MSTFNLLVILLFILLFGAAIFIYCVNIEWPVVSCGITLTILLLLIMEIIIALFEFPAAVIDGIIFISMGNEVIAIGCGIVIFIVLLFIFIIFYPKIKWGKMLAFSPLKYAIMGLLLIGALIYTELFNGSYSFRDLTEFNEFKQTFAPYDNHFWPTKFIREIDDNGREIITKTSVYPWDVNTSDGKQFAYKVVTYYNDADDSRQPMMYYYPFTYNTYAGIDAVPLLLPGADADGFDEAVSDSDSY